METTHAQLREIVGGTDPHNEDFKLTRETIPLRVWRTLSELELMRNAFARGDTEVATSALARAIYYTVDLHKSIGGETARTETFVRFQRFTSIDTVYTTLSMHLVRSFNAHRARAKRDFEQYIELFIVVSMTFLESLVSPAGAREHLTKFALTQRHAVEDPDPKEARPAIYDGGYYGGDS